MNWLALALGLGLCGACSQPDTIDRQQSAAVERQEPVKVLSAATLREMVAENGSVAIVRARATTITHRGTRGEAIWIEAEVIESLRGSQTGTIRMRGFTSKRDSRLDDGRLYVVALIPGAGDALLLTDFEDVPERGVAESVEKHRKALAEIGGAPNGNGGGS
jgi:hypothetical protein